MLSDQRRTKSFLTKIVKLSKIERGVGCGAVSAGVTSVRYRGALARWLRQGGFGLVGMDRRLEDPWSLALLRVFPFCLADLWCVQRQRRNRLRISNTRGCSAVCSVPARESTVVEQISLGETITPGAEGTGTVLNYYVGTGSVSVGPTIGAEQVILQEALPRLFGEIERVAIRTALRDGETPRRARDKGDALAIPVVEKVSVVVKRSVLREEEVQLRFVPVETLLKQKLRLSANEQPSSDFR